MPRIPPDILDATFYLYPTKEAAEEGKSFGGTGFFVGIATGRNDNSYFGYAITNWHVAVRDGHSVVRLNKKAGGIDIFETDPSDWDFDPRGPDMAVLPISNLGLQQNIHRTAAIDVNMFISQQSIDRYAIGPGEDIFMVGRFVDHDGGASNIPSVRMGNISVMPQKIEQPIGGSSNASFILDIHSRTGYSGSPVFAYRTHASDLTTPQLVISSNTHFIALLGLHWGQFPEEWEIKTGKKVTPQAASLSGDEQYIKGMSGMSVAIPAWDIMNFLNKPKYKAERDEALRRMGRDMSPKAESANAGGEAANPTHREDFNSLVSAAARKREPKD